MDRKNIFNVPMGFNFSFLSEHEIPLRLQVSTEEFTHLLAMCVGAFFFAENFSIPRLGKHLKLLD